MPTVGVGWQSADLWGRGRGSSNRGVGGALSRLRWSRHPVTCCGLKWQAHAARDAFCMHLYALAFDWTVLMLNERVVPLEHTRSVGILDVYGFENFLINGST